MPIILSVPKLALGVIGYWSGSVETIPSGWSLCDGTNGTPDLRDKFVIGSGWAFVPGDTGGSSLHTHAFTANLHSHTIAPGTGLLTGLGHETHVSSVAESGTTDQSDITPPFYSLLYLMYTG